MSEYNYIRTKDDILKYCEQEKMGIKQQTKTTN